MLPIILLQVHKSHTLISVPTYTSQVGTYTCKISRSQKTSVFTSNRFMAITLVMHFVVHMWQFFIRWQIDY
jgi:hypothetical protein